MKFRENPARPLQVCGAAFLWTAVIVLAWHSASVAATLPALWRHAQELRVSAPGVLKLSLPVETLDAARAGLEDVRLFDDAGNEVPYLIERPAPAAAVSQSAASFQVRLTPSATVIMLESGLTQPLDEITLESPAVSFVKAVRVEGSTDLQSWSSLATGQLIFRQFNGASQLQVRLPIAGTWKWLMLTVDDQRSQPIPFTGASVRAAVERLPSEPVPVRITQRQESPGETRLTLSLGAANLNIASVRLESAEPLFTRQVSIAAPQIQGTTVREQTLAQGVVYRVDSGGQQVSTNLTIPVEAEVHSRELLMRIRDMDSPPLSITGAHAERHPVYLTFYARQAGVYHLLTGNAYSAAPHYDLSALNSDLKNLAISSIKLAPIADNPDYRPPENLPGTEANNAALDVSAWADRKRVQLRLSGGQQAELDLDVLAHAQRGLQDLRLMRAGRQVPYFLNLTSRSRAIAPAVKAADGKDPKLQRWELRLPNSALPVTRLTCVSKTAIFQRDLVLYEDAADGRGQTQRHVLGRASWVQTPNRTGGEFVMTLDEPAQTGILTLETNNGDNPPVALENFQLFYPVSEVVFNSNANDELYLYYGNPDAASPHYDLTLVAAELMAADRSPALLLEQEQLRKSSWTGGLPGTGGPLLWLILGLVVTVLLIIIARALPAKTP